MQLHELQPKNTFGRKKRVGRGGKKGTYCGTGGKGQKGRAGSRFKPLVREWLKKYPKLKGYNFNILTEPSVAVDLAKIESKFENNATVSPKNLAEKKIIQARNKKLPQVKITGMGNITKAIIVVDCKVSKAAREKIEKAGGEIKMGGKRTAALTKREEKAKIKAKDKEE